MKISDIAIGNRVRQDMGDIKALADSIKQNGLLQPVCVDTENYLVDGQRRILAAQSLGWTDISVHVVELESLLQAQYDANELRKSFTPSEKVALAERIRASVEAKAKRRQEEGAKEGGRGHKKPGGSASRGLTKSRDIIAKAAGTSYRTLEKAAEVVKAAEVDPANSDLVEEMDRTGNVSGAYHELQERGLVSTSKEEERGKIKLQGDGTYSSNELKKIAQDTKATVVSLIVHTPDGRQKKMGSISTNWFENRNILRWIVENVGLGKEEKDIIIHRKGNLVFVFDSDHVENLVDAVVFLHAKYSNKILLSPVRPSVIPY